MKEHITQINHLAEVLHTESKDLDTIGKSKAELYQSIINEMQDHLDKIVNELIAAEQA